MLVQNWIFLKICARSTILFSLLLALANIQSQAAEHSNAKDIVAIQLRAQGIPCTSPSDAEKDKRDSRPDEMTWIISCKEATYRVTLIPHVGSKVEILDTFDRKPDDEKKEE
jgi:hypothetical protein